MCRSPQGPLFFGKKPQLFPLSPYLHPCIIPYYRAFGQSVFSKSGSKRAKKPPKAKEKPLPSQLPSLGKIHSFPPGSSEKIPGTQRFRGFSSVLAGFGPCPLFSCNALFSGVKGSALGVSGVKIVPVRPFFRRSSGQYGRPIRSAGTSVSSLSLHVLESGQGFGSLQGAALMHYVNPFAFFTISSRYLSSY